MTNVLITRDHLEQYLSVYPEVFCDGIQSEGHRIMAVYVRPIGTPKIEEWVAEWLRPYQTRTRLP